MVVNVWRVQVQWKQEEAEEQVGWVALWVGFWA
jgi:hypothetical protein